MSTLELRPLLVIDVDVEPVADLGPFPFGERRVVTFAGGTFTGRDGLAGTIAPGGVDWQTVRSDGVIEIAAHYLLRTDADEPIEIHSTGLRKASLAVAVRIADGGPVDPSEYYFRTHVRLATSAPRLAWLNDLLAVATGARHRATVRIDVHEVV